MMLTQRTRRIGLCLAAALAVVGCARSRGLGPVASSELPPAHIDIENAAALGPPSLAAAPLVRWEDRSPPQTIQLVSANLQEPVSPAAKNPEASENRDPAASDAVQLDEVIDAVVRSYPLLQVAVAGRNVASGDLIAASGEFDLKLKGDSLNMPLGFYENYRHSLGAEQPLWGGGTLLGGYRQGIGRFPTYYGERETKLGGEFKVGVALPLAQNRAIDDRRAQVWRNRWELRAVEPEIQTQLIEFIRLASSTYWNWIAAGQNVRVAEALLKNAAERTEGLQSRVKQGDAPQIDLTDNERLVVSRTTKLIDAQRKLQQTAYKLSLFLRDGAGQPIVVDQGRLPRQFPTASDPSSRNLAADIEFALANRPELRSLEITGEQLRIDLAAAQNLLLPQLDALLFASQDVGNPADPNKDDKTPLELEGGLVGSVPLQRRKAKGKAAAVEGKLAQVRAKTQFTQEKIVAQVQSASAAWNAAYQQLAQARRGVELARQMEAAERRKFDLGDSNLLLVNLREQATADAATTEVEAGLSYFDAETDYRAALAADVAP